MTTAIVFAVVAIAWLAAGMIWQADARRRDAASLVCLRLSFDRSTTRDQVVAFFSGLSGLRSTWWRRAFNPSTVTIEVVVDDGKVEHRVIFPERLRHRVDDVLDAHLGQIRVEEVDVRPLTVTMATDYRITDHDRLLRTDEGLARGLLTALGRLPNPSSAVLQVQCTPGGPTPGTAHADQQPGWRQALGLPAPTPASQAERTAKRQLPLFHAVLRIGVQHPDIGTARRLLRQVEAPLHGANRPGVHLRRRVDLTRRARREIVTRRPPTGGWPLTVSAGELPALCAFPTTGITATGLTLAGSRQLPVSAAIPTTGSILGDGLQGGRPRAVAMDLDARVRHLTVVGSTGTGKSTLLTHLAVDDIARGWGCVLIDAKGHDLADEVLGRLDPVHHHRVCVLDVADQERPVGFNPLHQGGPHPELAVEHLVATMHRVWHDSWGVRTDDVIRMALRTLATDDASTVADVVPLLVDPVFRRPFLERISDPTVLSFWRQFGGLSDGEVAQWVAPPANKLRALVARPGLRRVFAQADPKLDLAEHINSGGVLIVPLNAGMLGADAAALVGSLVVSGVWNAIEQRRPGAVPLSLFLDELAAYAHLPVPLEEVLSRSRSFGVAATLAFQHLDQLPGDLRHAVLANPRSLASFQVAASDARVLMREFGQGITADDLQGLDAYQMVAKVHAAGRTQPAATITTRPPTARVVDPATVRARSREVWGVDGAEIDAALIRRHEPQRGRPDAPPPGPAGRKRRPR